MALATVKSIEQALILVDAKKNSLKIAFEQLQSFSSLLSSFNFTWTDLDSHFSSIQSEILHEFSALQALESSQAPKPEKRKDSFLSEPVPARPQLKSLCESMDAVGLRKYVIDRPKERIAIRVELADAFKHAPDPGTLVLDALEGFWDGKAPGSRLRTACVVVLEELMRAGVEIGPEVRERAKVVAAEWKVQMAALDNVNGGDGDEEGKEEEWGLEKLGYLQLLASYKLLTDGGYDANELVEYVVLSARYRQTVDLCRVLCLESKISDVVQRLISKGKQLLALKFVFEFELTDDFPPVPLLEAYLMDSKKIAQKVRKSGKNSRQSLNDAAMKEISALKSVIKCIEDHGLESQYPKDEMLMHIEKLEKEKADRKRPAMAPVPKSQQPMKQPKQNGNKRMKAISGPSAYKRKLPFDSVNRPSQPSLAQQAGSLPDHTAPYLTSSSGVYGMAGSIVAAAPYRGLSSELYALSGTPMGFPGNVNPSTSNAYPSETHAQPSYYDPAVGYAGYEVPSQYHPVYYPQ